MLVVVACLDAEVVTWRGRRHDDDGPGVVHGEGTGALFDEVFRALHDGEQVAIGFPGRLSAPVDGAEASVTGMAQLEELLRSLGDYRPWTAVSTSLPRWRATTSVLLWETPDTDVDAVVEAFYALVTRRADRGQEDWTAPVANLAAACAQRAGLTVDPAQLSEPVVSVTAAGR